MNRNNSFDEIYDKLSSSNKILMSLHLGPDGDSFSCCLAMKYFLERDFNAEVKLISPDPVDEVLQKLDWAKEIEFGKSYSDFDFDDFDLILCLDSSEAYRIGLDAEKLGAVKCMNIDHHDTNAFFADLNYVDAKRPSCSSILMDLFREKNVKFDSELSTRLLLGVYSDAGLFQNSNSDESIIDAAFLIEQGAKYFDFIVMNVVKKTPLRIKQYRAYLVSQFVQKDSFGYSLCSAEKVAEFKLNLAEVRMGSSVIQDMGGTDFIFFIADMGDFQKVSFRSSSKVDVSQFASFLGGGGHKFAAAANLDGITLDEAKEKVLEAIEKVGIHKA